MGGGRYMATNRSAADQGQRDAYEAEFHDARIESEADRKLGYAYASVKDVYAFTEVPPGCRDGAVLELGCFRGGRASALRGFTGKYIGIDISPAAVAHCNALGLPANFEFKVDNANTLATIEDGVIDYAFGDGVLHHLDLACMAPVLARKLSSGGRARFIEPAQGNFLLRAFRKLTPRLRTPDEHPFDRDSIATLERHFSVAITYQGLLRPLVPMLFGNSRQVMAASRKMDERLLQLPVLQRQAWLLQIELRPR